MWLLSQLLVHALTASLTAETTWRCKLSLDKLREPIIASILFRPDDNFEPPQGTLELTQCLPEAILPPTPRYKPPSDQFRPRPPTGPQPPRWTLSEDPDDRKDSLWIWGLFKEPLYPFILFSLPCGALELDDGSTLPAGALYIQASHRRDPQLGTLLGEGVVSYRVDQSLQADLVGLSDFTYSEPITCGTCSFTVG